MSLSSSEVLFLSKGLGAIPWYRCGMPALWSGCDWASVIDRPPNLQIVGGLKRGGLTMPRFEDYRIIVVQQPAGSAWVNQILDWREKGIHVFYEIDDHLHSVRKIKSHKARGIYHPKVLKEHEMCMKASSGLIVSTEFLGTKYRRFNPNVYVCRNCVEGERYKLFERPERDTINIGWAGGEGHAEVVESWRPAIEAIMAKYQQVRFIAAGLPVSELFDDKSRITQFPYVQVETVPAVMMNFDIAIAPSGRNDFFRAKSDLRWLETGALGIPLVADPFVYGDIRDDHDGFHARNADEAEAALEYLVGDPELRSEIGGNAQERILNERAIEQGFEQWVNVFTGVI